VEIYFLCIKRAKDRMNKTVGPENIVQKIVMNVDWYNEMTHYWGVLIWKHTFPEKPVRTPARITMLFL